MNPTALDETIERLTDEVRRAKQECLAFFVSLQVSAEELRQIQGDMRETEALMKICREDNMVSFGEYQNLLGLFNRQLAISNSLTFHIPWETQTELAVKFTRYREVLTQLNQHLELDRYRAPVIEFRRDHRRSNHPPTY